VQNPSKVEKIQGQLLREIVHVGCQQVSTGLSKLLNIPIKVEGTVIGFIPIAEIPMLTGDPEGMVNAARVALGGELSGYMIFMLTAKSWEICKKLLIDESSAPSMELSAFAELANIACSCFISNLSDRVQLAIPFSPPEVMEDMTATVLQDTLVMFSDAPTLLTVEITLTSQKARLKGYLFFIPAEESFRNLATLYSRIKSSP
jgi:chemotaxis protein CheC